jgi:hypothetical protein
MVADGAEVIAATRAILDESRALGAHFLAVDAALELALLESRQRRALDRMRRACAARNEPDQRDR